MPRKTTLDDLAGMVKRGFDGVDKRFDRVDQRLDKIVLVVQYPSLKGRGIE